MGWVKSRCWLSRAPAAGVPLRTPVDALNVTPLGRAPTSLSVGVGEPVVVTVKLPAAPTVKVVLLALVMAGAWVAWLTVRGKRSEERRVGKESRSRWSPYHYKKRVQLRTP